MTSESLKKKKNKTKQIMEEKLEKIRVKKNHKSTNYQNMQTSAKGSLCKFMAREFRQSSNKLSNDAHQSAIKTRTINTLRQSR